MRTPRQSRSTPTWTMSTSGTTRGSPVEISFFSIGCLNTLLTEPTSDMTSSTVSGSIRGFIVTTLPRNLKVSSRAATDSIGRIMTSSVLASFHAPTAQM